MARDLSGCAEDLDMKLIEESCGNYLYEYSLLRNRIEKGKLGDRTKREFKT